MSKKYIWLLLVIILPLAWFLFKPLTSDQFEMYIDPALKVAKVEYLSQVQIDSSRKPNILWIVVDDLGYFDTDLYGKGLVPTPNINRIGDAGIRFTNAYTTSPVCSPSRSGMLTGRYNQRFGFEHQVHDRYLKNRMEYYGFKYLINSDPWEPEYRDEVPNEDFVSHMGLSQAEITVAEVLKAGGYQTALMGKWHVSAHPENSPQQFGFDQFYGFYASHSLYSPEGTEGIVDVKNDRDWTDDYIWSGQRDGLHAIEKNGEVIEEHRYLTQSITEESIAFIDQVGNEPFFLMASYNAPHTPFQVPQNYYDQFAHVEDPVERVYQAMILCLDDEIGKLLDHLYATGKMENTLVFFISDNGGAAYTYATDNGGLKGGKITNFEGGVRVPFAMMWNGIHAGSTYDFPVSTTDLFSTSIYAAGIPLPGRTIDGVDLVQPIATGKPAHDLIYFRKGYNQAVRSLSHKLIWNSRTMDTLLYKIDTDPFEKENIFGQSPEVVADMLKKYNQWNEDLMSPQWPSVVGFNFTDVDGKTYTFEN